MEKSINYIVKPEHGIVVCILKDDEYTTWRGVAKCSKEDVFNEDIGKKIAFLRACSMRARNYLRSEKEVLKYFNSQINMYEESRMKSAKIIDKKRIQLANYAQDIDNLSNGKI